MSTHKIIKELLDENLIAAKREIEEALYEKLGEHLNEMYVDIAPTLLGEAKKSKKKKKKKKNGARPDFLDLDGDGDTEEPMKRASRQMKEDYDEMEEDETEEEDDDTEEEGNNPGMKSKMQAGAASSAAATLRPGGAPRDEPGDLSQRKAQIMSAIGNSSAANTGTDAY